MTDDATGPRSTTTPTVARTAAATVARQRAHAGRLVVEMASRLDLLDDRQLVALASVLVTECVKRGIGDRICE